MKNLHLTREQAYKLSEKLKEYVELYDDNGEEVFESFIVTYGDPASENPTEDCTLELNFKPKWVEI